MDEEEWMNINTNRKDNRVIGYDYDFKKSY